MVCLFKSNQIKQVNRNKKCIEWSSLEILNEIVNKEIQTLEFNLATEEDVCLSDFSRYFFCSKLTYMHTLIVFNEFRKFSLV